MPRPSLLSTTLVALAAFAMPGATIEVPYGGGALQLDLQLDEVEIREPGAASTVAAIPAADAEGLRLAAAARRGTALAVAWPKGAPRTPGNRRVITRMVNLRLAPGAEIQAIAAAHGLRVVAPQTFASRTWLVEAVADDLLAAVHAAAALRGEAGVEWAEPVIERVLPRRATPNDPQFPGQWHLASANGNHINVQGVWDTWRGAGVNIAILDDGLEIAHPDLAANCPAVASGLHHNFRTDRSEDGDPSPAGPDHHGTMVGGLSAAVGNNGVGVSGVAYEARLLGLRLIGSETVTNATPNALSWQASASDPAQQVWVSNNSWGPNDDGIVAEPIGSADLAALTTGVTSGRGGRGTVYLFAAGNGGDLRSQEGAEDSCSYDPYSNVRFVMGIGATMPDGSKASYSEEGCDLFANAPGGNSPSDGMVGTDRSGAEGYDKEGDYTTLATGGGGTSWATPVASGVVALLLQSRPQLTWRDVQALVARTAAKNDPGHPSWQSLSSGRSHSNRYGFGRMDAGALVAAGANWTLLPAESPAVTAGGVIASQAIPEDANGTAATFTVDAPADLRCEAVLVTVSVTHPRRGDLAFTLTDPAGNVATVPRRPADTTADLAEYTFKSVLHHGVPAAGTWTLRAIDAVSGTTGTLTAATLAVHGYRPYPVPVVSALSVASIAAGSGDTQVTITGSGFVRNASNEVPMTTVSIGGAAPQALPAQVVGDGVMTVTIPAARLVNGGSLDLVIANPALPADLGGGGGNAGTRSITITGGGGSSQVSAFVTRFYQQCLSREPDAGGLASWSGDLVSRTRSGADVARGFVLSQEFRNRNLSDSDYLDVLYRAFFGREPDAGGKAGWMAELGRGVLREDVLYGFVRAQEFANLCEASAISAIDTAGSRRYEVRQFARRFYQQCLRREPDEGGVNAWTDSLLTGANTGADVARGFVLSQEFINQRNSDETFVDLLYRSFFDREPDAGGRSSWLGALASGTSRSTVLDGFIRAQEFVNLCNRYAIVPFPTNG